MLRKPEPACFLIADISGYTSYLAGVELDHAQDIISDLMNTVVKCLRPPFRLVKFEGDAAFLCAPGDTFDGSMIQDAIESAYFGFRKRSVTSDRPHRANARHTTGCSNSTSSLPLTTANSSSKGWVAATNSQAAMSFWFIAC